MWSRCPVTRCFAFAVSDRDCFAFTEALGYSDTVALTETFSYAHGRPHGGSYAYAYAYGRANDRTDADAYRSANRAPNRAPNCCTYGCSVRENRP